MYRPADKFVRLVFNDSWQMIPSKLSDFSEMFDLKSVKETTCHSIMTQSFISGGGLASAKDLIDAGVSAEDAGTIVSNAKSWGCFSPCERVDMVKYNLHYCMGDVRLLRDGVRAFMDGVRENMNINGWCYSTIAGIADAYFTGRKSYNKVCLMWGVNRDYVAQSAVGGRVMVRENSKLKFSRALSDFDAAALYPSAIKRIAKELGGFPTGSEKLWHAGVDLKKVTSFVVTVKILSVQRADYSFPLLSDLEDGRRVWTNDVVGKQYVINNIEYGMIERFMGAEMEVIEGLYWDGNPNPECGQAVTDLFNIRAALKKAGNPKQNVMKLALNASYGRNGMRPVETDVVYDERGFGDIMNVLSHSVKSCEEVHNDGLTAQVHRVETYREVDQHENRIHIAGLILAMSKLIMAEVCCLADDISMPDKPCLHYTDTDSIHIDADMVKPLADAFRVKYDRELIGSDMGQFHDDFGKLKMPDGSKSKQVPHSVESIFLGKKSYCDILEDDAGGVRDIHYRMKSIPSKVLEHKAMIDYCREHVLCIQFKNNRRVVDVARAREIFKGEVRIDAIYDLYEKLFHGDEVVFDMCAGGAVNFRLDKREWPADDAQQIRSDGSICENQRGVGG